MPSDLSHVLFRCPCSCAGREGSGILLAWLLVSTVVSHLAITIAVTNGMASAALKKIAWVLPAICALGLVGDEQFACAGWLGLGGLLRLVGLAPPRSAGLRQSTTLILVPHQISIMATKVKIEWDRNYITHRDWADTDGRSRDDAAVRCCGIDDGDLVRHDQLALFGIVGEHFLVVFLDQFLANDGEIGEGDSAALLEEEDYGADPVQHSWTAVLDDSLDKAVGRPA